MKTLFPILIAIVTTTLVLTILMNSGKSWYELSEEEKKVRKVLLAIGIVFFLGGLVLFILLV